jgi:phage tail tape-measure protein
MRFGGKPLPAGNWALISRSDSQSTGNFTNVMVNCYALGTRVVRVEPGVVNLISVGAVGGGRGAAGDAEVVDQARQVLAGYPGIAAPVKPVVEVGTVGFATGKGLLGQKNCQITEAGRFVPAK